MVNTDEADLERRLAEEVKAALVDYKLPCPAAFKTAKKLNVNRWLVGDMANKLRVRIVDCQLGCFQVKKATHDDIADLQVSDALADEINASLFYGFLPCDKAFDIAKKQKVSPKDVGDTATKLKIRIISCQLGCFL